MGIYSDIEEASKSVKKHGWWKTLIYLLINVVVSSGSGYLTARQYVSNKIQINNSFVLEDNSSGNSKPTAFATTNDNSPVPLPTPQVDGTNTDKNFNESDWTYDQNRIYKEKDDKGRYTGFFCVRKSDNWDSGEIWYRQLLAVGSTVISRYETKTDQKLSKRAPKLIFVFSEDRNFRMFFPDEDPNFIGFDDRSSLKKIKPRRLPSQIDNSKISDLEISIGNNNPNQAVFNYSLKYIPIVESGEAAEQLTTSNSFTSVFPWPNPTSDGAKQKIGFGTFNGSCIRLSYFDIK